VGAGLTRFNLSLNAMSKRKSMIIAGWGFYDIEKIKKMARRMAEKTELWIAPVYLPGFNDEEIPEIVKFAKEIGAEVGIQNFLRYKRGRNPVKEKSWDEFDQLLAKWEQETGMRLKVTKEDFHIVETKPYPKPFKKGDIIEAEIRSDGRYPHEKLAVAQDRIIALQNCTKTGTVRVKINRSKHNIFYGQAV